MFYNKCPHCAYWALFVDIEFDIFAVLVVQAVVFCTVPCKFLLVLASTVILGSESRGTHDHILLSHYTERRTVNRGPSAYDLPLYVNYYLALTMEPACSSETMIFTYGVKSQKIILGNSFVKF
jgi:hypothetical protein